MGEPQKPKKPREKSKTRAWEKERRNRINDYFNKLWEVLPIYDSSKPIISKPDILINAVSTIKDLNERLEKLLATSDGEKLSVEKFKVSSDIIEKLQVRVKKLLLRNEQLADLLNKAGIQVPAECGTVKKLRRAHKYSNVVSPEQKAHILQKELEKENQVKVSKRKAPKAGVKRKRVLKGKDKKLKKQLVSPSNCLLLVSQPAVTNNSSICFILSKTSAKVNQTVIPNSSLVKAPVLSTDIKAPPFPIYQQLPNLGQGSVVLPFSIAPNILSNPPQLSTVIVVSSKNTVPVNNVNSLPILKIRSSVTKTTQVNKVPIPALSSKYYKHTCLSNKKSDQNPAKKRTQRPENAQNETKKLKSTSDSTSEKAEVEKQGESNVPESSVPKSLDEGPVKKPTEPKNSAADVPKAATELKENPVKPPDILAPTSTDNAPVTSQAEPVNSETSSGAPQVNESIKVSPTKSFPATTCQSSKPSQINSSSSNITDFKSLEMALPQTELSNDIFASFQVPPGCQNPESTSPTAAFLLAFPLVSSGAKVAEVMGDEIAERHSGTPNLLQIGTMDIAKPVQSYAESLTPNLLNFDSFSFFNNKDYCGGGGVYNGKAAGAQKGEQPKASEGLNNYGGCSEVVMGHKPLLACHSNSNNNNNNNKGDISAKVSTQNSGFTQTVGKTSVLDVNSDIFSFKPHENYPSNNRHQSLRPPFTSSNSFPDYSSYNNKSVSNSSAVVNKYYPPVYTSAGVNNASYYNAFCGGGGDNSSSYGHNYADYNRKSFASSCSINQKTTKLPSSQNKPINWMTTPSTTTTAAPSYKPSDYFLPPLQSNSYFNSSSVYNPNDHLNIAHQDFRNYNNSYQQRTEAEENNQFSWSPNKIPHFLDTTTTSHAHSFVSSTLPTLVGDLALNNTDHHKERSRDNRRKTGNCENPTNFFSVSQLVEQSQENVPAKVVSRRSSGGNRSKPSSNNTAAKAKRASKEPPNSCQKVRKNNPSSYSAEALIGNHHHHHHQDKGQNKSVVPSFFNDNVVSYFPTLEVPQENSYVPQSYYQAQPFQNNSGYGVPPTSSFSNNNNTNSFIMPNASSQDFPLVGDTSTTTTNLFQGNASAANSNDNKCSSFAKTYLKPPEKDLRNTTLPHNNNNNYNSCTKKAKKPIRSLNDNNVLPSFDIHFFSMPAAINSPILPDDFHATYLPSCKNPLYTKPNSEAAISGCLIPPLPGISGNKPPTSPSVNPAGTTTTLTNFNLSTIFPEIKKGPIQEAFSDNRKTYPIPPPPPSASVASSSLQVPFNNKSSIIF